MPKKRQHIVKVKAMTITLTSTIKRPPAISFKTIARGMAITNNATILYVYVNQIIILFITKKKNKK